MKFQVKIAVIGVGLVMASSGVIYPMQGGIEAREQEVESLELQRSIDETVPGKVKALHAEVLDMRSRSALRPKNLCPDTPEAQQQVEKAVLGHVRSAGLITVRTVSGTTVRTGKYPYRTIDLIVEGDAQALQSLFHGLEEMPWVTRILKLSVDKQGESRRRITLQVAVMLEAKS
jgi:hypothetical protein